MRKPTRNRNRSTNWMLSHVIHQALRDGQTVELVDGDQSLAIAIDGVEVAPIASESFDWPLDRYEFDDEAAALVEECLERSRDRNQTRRFEWRKRKLATEQHTESEGINEL